jgi:C4-dicarboxylate-specific signal transduction histidine kinase
MEDNTTREVAQQLGLGLRLVKRIIEDMRLALEGEVNP